MLQSCASKDGNLPSDVVGLIGCCALRALVLRAFVMVRWALRALLCHNCVRGWFVVGQ